MEGEKRSGHRQALKYPAQIELGDGSPPRMCELMNISATGARITVQNAEEIPDHFVLLLSPKQGASRDCRVAWRQDNELGLQFLNVAGKSRVQRPPAKTSAHVR